MNSRLLSALAILIFTACQKQPVTPPTPVGPVPSESQLQWHDMEMNAFIHFTINTFTDLEWGMGSESETLFNPAQLDVNQWITVLKDTGFKGVILTCKHHDGFCLWPSEYTTHSVKKSPLQDGKADIVKMVADACRTNGLKFGVYLSPWDRNHADYGKPAYIDYYRSQLNELFTDKYGPIFEMWFDGANGGTGYYGGANEKRSINGATYYDWPSTLALVKQREPNVIFFSDAGPGVRWVGNERGVAGETNWNTISTDTLYAGKAGIEKLLNTGSEGGEQWVPAETDVSIRPGWFYHAKEDSLVKTPQQLFGIYMTSVGRGSLLLLNVPPDRRGLLHENDVKSLKGFRELLDRELGIDIAPESSVAADSWRGNNDQFAPGNLTDNNPETYWTTDENIGSATIELTFTKLTQIKYVAMQEYIRLGQRVKGFTISYDDNGQWKLAATGTTIGHKRIISFSPVQTQKLQITITDTRACPVISSISVY